MINKKEEKLWIIGTNELLWSEVADFNLWQLTVLEKNRKELRVLLSTIEI